MRFLPVSCHCSPKNILLSALFSNSFKSMLFS
jgi:hypothetical protein